MFSFKFDALKSGISLKQLRHVVRGLDMLNENEVARSTELFGLLDVEPNSKSLGIKRGIPSISISFKYVYISATFQCKYITQRILSPGFELVTTLS